MNRDPTQQRVILWSVPRSLSSAFYRAMMNRPNTKGFNEPYSEPYYHGTEKVSHRYDFINQEHTFKGVTSTLEEPYTDFQTVFVKDMSFYPLQVFKTNVKDILPTGYTHTFLIRNPKYTVPSFYKLSTDPEKTGWRHFDPKEVGFKESFQLFEEVKDSTEVIPIVIDATDLLGNPEAVLRAYCNSTNMEFYPSMLQWEDNPYTTLLQPDWPDGWYSQVISSNTFIKHVEKDDTGQEFPDVVYKTIESNMKYYLELKKHCLSPAQS